MGDLFIAIDDKFLKEKIEIAKKYKIGAEFVLFQNESNLFDENKINFIKNQKIRTLVIHGPYYFFKDEWIEKKKIIEIIKQTFHVAEKLNAEKIVFHSGYNGENDREVIKLWKEISKINDDFNIFLENTREEPEKIAEFIDKINDERIKVCLDIGHMFVYSKSSLDKWIDILANRLRYVHIHNNDGIKDQHLPLLKGKFDMKDVFIKVKSFDVCLEAFGDIKEIEEDIKRLIEWYKTKD